MRKRERPDRKTSPDQVVDREKLSEAMSAEPAPIDIRAFAARAGRIIAKAARKARKSFRRYRPSE